MEQKSLISVSHNHYWELCLNPEGKVSYLSPSLYEITGFRPEDIINDPKQFTRIIHPEDLPQFEANVLEAYAQRLPGEMEFRIVRPDGEVRWINHLFMPLFDEHGQYAGTKASSWDITDRKKAEEIIKTQRDLGLALDNIPFLAEVLKLCLETAIKVSGLDAGGIYVLDETTGDLNLVSTLGISDQFAMIAGKSPAGSERTTMVLAGNPVYLNGKLLQDLQTADITGEKICSVAVLPFSDKGRIIGCLNIASRIHYDIPTQRRTALELIARQIGAAVARAQAEQSLRVSEEKYRAIFENAVEGIFQTTPEGQILSANPAMAKLFGYDSPSDFIGSLTNVVQLYANPDDRLSFRREIERKGTVNKYEVSCVRKDGLKMLIAINARVIKDQNGHITSYDGFYEDITERKKMEDDLRKSEERFRSIVETSNAGIIMMTTEGQILFANQQMAKMLGYGAEEVIGTNYNGYIHPEDRKNIADNISLLKNGTLDQVRVQRRYICKDNIERWGYVSGGRIDVGHPDHHVVLVISDITELRQVESEKKLLEDHLRQSQKMEAIGTLAGGIAHDFNNILASIMGYTEMAGKEARQDVRRDYLEQVLQACQRAKNLVNQILAFSRQREQERKPVDIRLILKEALSLLRATLPTTIEIKQDISREETPVLADPTQIHQVIMNLCTNAAHSMREKGGLLDIHLSNIEILRPMLSPHPDLQVGSYVHLSVRDTGHGIDATIIDKIFYPFFTTKKAKEGTGMGLSVVYGIVKSSGGAITVQSSAGLGATFDIYLPRIRPENRIPEKKQEDIDLRGNERILFVDDEEMLVSMVKIFFQQLGYQITATTSSSEAWRLVHENPQGFDLVITDMTMPQMTGAELSRALLKIRPGLPIILCTGYSDSINTADARKLNIREFILKPISLNDLGLSVRRVLKSLGKNW